MKSSRWLKLIMIIIASLLFSKIVHAASSITFTKPTDYQVIANVYSSTLVQVEIDYSWVESYWGFGTKRILKTDNGNYDTSSGGIPTYLYRTAGSYTWTIELWELNVGGYWVKTAEDQVTFYLNFRVYAENNFGSGTITLDGQTKSSYSYVNKYIGYSVNASAIDQSNYIWNTNGTNDSEWGKRPYSGDLSSLGVNTRSISYTVQSNDNGASLVAGMRLNCSVTFENNLPGLGDDGVITVSSTQYNSPTSSFTVVEDNPISATAINQTISGIYFSFDEWSTGSGSSTTTFYPDETPLTYTANFNARPTNTYRSLSFNDGEIGEDIELTWNAHQLDNDGITKYDIYRKVKYNGVMGAESKIGTRYANGSATYSFIDNSYQVADGTTIRNNFYDVRAYYQPSATYANPEFVSIYADCLQNYQNSNTGTDAADAVMTPSAEEEVTPTETTLGNYPNPFNPNTVINYQLAVDSKVVLKVYDMLGKEVATLVNDTKPAGSYNVSFNGSNLPSGVYIYMLQTNSQSITRKMLLMK